MKVFRVAFSVLLASGCLGAQATWAAEPQDTKMKKLAATSGCFTCHSIEAPGKPGPDGLAPIGPAWQDVANKYKGQKNAAERLTKAVMQGSSPYDSHWKGKVSGLAMPPNAVAIKDPDAKKLVAWILSLAK